MDAEQRVQAELAARGLDWRVERHASATGTAEQAAAAVGCSTEQIVKTLCFFAGGRPTLALVGGDRQVDTARLAGVVGVSRKKLRMGAVDEVLVATGFPIGGVSPFATANPCDIVADVGLRSFADVWVAAGSANAVFRAQPERLVAELGGQWAVIARDRRDG